jgi:membrane protease YdiL (CAAX protease family)
MQSEPLTVPHRSVARELGLVLAVGVLPMILIGATLFPPSAEEPPPPFPIAGVSPGLRAALMGLTYLCFFLAPAVAIARSGQPLAHFGIRWNDRKELTWALVGFHLNYILGWAIWLAYRATGFPLGIEHVAAYHYMHVTSLGELVATWPWYVLVIIAEELMARCYLITRFHDLTGSPAFAVVASSVLFAGWHTFWGAAGVVHILKAGLVFGWLFWMRRSVASPAIAHFIYDALALLPR